MPANRITFNDRTDAYTPAGVDSEVSAVHINAIKTAINEHADRFGTANAAVLAGVVDGDVTLANLEPEQAFHFQVGTLVTLTSAQGMVSLVDGSLSIIPSNLSIPAGTQGYMLKDASGQISVAYTTGGGGGTVVPATADLTTTNGVMVKTGQNYTSFTDGTSWATPSVCEYNEFIHNVADYHLAIAHEGAGGTTMTINVNGIDATYDNLNAATDSGAGLVTFSSGTNQNFNRRASTIESIREPGKYFEITKPATGQFDTQIVSLTTAPETPGNLQLGTYRLRFNGSQMDILAPDETIVATATPENGTYRVTRTLAGFRVEGNGVEIYSTACDETVNYSNPPATTHVFDGLMVDAFPAWEGAFSIAANATATLSTGIDLSQVEELRIHFGRNNNTWGSISYAFDPAQIDLNATQGELIPHFGDTYLSIDNMSAADFAAGDFPFRALTGATFGFVVTKIEFKKRAVGVSRRLGEMVHIKASRFVDDADANAQGYLAVKPGTVTNGATDYPLWAAIYSEFVSGNDIVFPADVDGLFLRNAGGNAAAEGVFQADENKAHTHAYTDTIHPNFRQEGGGSNVVRQGSSDLNKTTASEGDVEARPVNRAYQLYTIVDTYVEIPGGGSQPSWITNAPGTSGQTLTANGDGTATWV